MANEVAVKQFFSSLLALGVQPREGFIPDAAARIWAEALGDEVTEAELRASALLWSRAPEGRWWPTPGDIIRLVRQAQSPMLGGEDLWAIVLKYGLHFGSFRLQDGTPKPAIFKDPDTEARAQEAVRLVGGWKAILLAPEAELPHVRRHWCAAYDRICERESVGRDAQLFGRAVTRIEERQARQIEQRTASEVGADASRMVAQLAARMKVGGDS